MHSTKVSVSPDLLTSHPCEPVRELSGFGRRSPVRTTVTNKTDVDRVGAAVCG
jgi:hypothetical protein